MCEPSRTCPQNQQTGSLRVTNHDWAKFRVRFTMQPLSKGCFVFWLLALAYTRKGKNCIVLVYCYGKTYHLSACLHQSFANNTFSTILRISWRISRWSALRRSIRPAISVWFVCTAKDAGPRRTSATTGRCRA